MNSSKLLELCQFSFNSFFQNLMVIANEFHRITFENYFLMQRSGKSIGKMTRRFVVWQNGTETGAFKMKSAGRKGNRVKEKGREKRLEHYICASREWCLWLFLLCRHVFLLLRITLSVNSRLWRNMIRKHLWIHLRILLKKWNNDLY